MSEHHPSRAAGEEPRRPRVVVGIGGHSHDVSMTRQLLRSLPRHDDLAYVLVQPPGPHPLSSATPMRIEEASRGELVLADVVYLVDPAKPLTISGGRFEREEPRQSGGQPLDRVFRSLARHYGDRAVGLRLGGGEGSGGGVDGTAGLRAIRNAGGLALTQAPPQGAQSRPDLRPPEAGAVDMAVPLHQMGELVRKFLVSAGPPPASGDGGEPAGWVDEQMRAHIVSIIDHRENFDASAYRAKVIDRRIVRRMLLGHFDDARAYATWLSTDEAERRALVRDLLTGVTEFFRDPEAFEALRSEVIEPMVRDAKPRATIRCWVAACSTGQEAYSLAMEWLESFRAHDKDLRLQMFATDVNDEALKIAKHGLYDASMMAGVGGDRLGAYFMQERSGYRVRPQLRHSITFMAHDLASDPPFSRMAMVSCRNMLIYVRTATQQHVLRSLRFALEPGGALLLGSTESPGAEERYFEVLSGKWRLYRRRTSSASHQDALPHVRSPRPASTASAAHDEAQRRASGRAETLRKDLLDAMVPPTVIVAPDGAIQYSHGELRPYLHFPQGENLAFDLPAMLSEEISARARATWYRCRQEQARATTTVTHGDGEGRTRITAVPLPRLPAGTVALSFEAMGDAGGAGELEPPSPASASAVSTLEAELEATRDDLRTTITELEAHNDQLWVYNKESARMNEELQLANEELESSAEELHSLNEELSTVNAQLRMKVEQLDKARDDIANFLSSTQIPTIILDQDLKIERLTPAASQQLGLHPSQCQSFIGSVQIPALGDDLLQEARAVLEDFGSRSREVELGDGRIFERRVHPYRIEGRRVAGVVVTWVDISDIRRAADALEKSEERLRLATDAANLGMFDVDLRNRTETWTPTLKRLFGLVPDALVPGNAIEAGYIHPEDAPQLKEKIMRSLEPGGDGMIHSEHRIRRADGEVRWLYVTSKTFFDGDDDRTAVRTLGMAMDITERKHTEQRLAESEARIRRLFDQAPALIAMHQGPQHVYEYSNPLHDRAVGGRQLLGLPLREAMPELEGQGIFERFDRVFETGEPVVTPAFSATFDRSGEGRPETSHYTQVLQPWFDPSGDVAGIMSFAFEVTADVERMQAAGDGSPPRVAAARMAAQSSLRASQEELQQALQDQGELLARLASDLDEPLSSMRVALQALQSLENLQPSHQIALQVLLEQADRLVSTRRALMASQRR